MVILTYIGISLLCLGYLGLIFVSLSSKPEQDAKNRKSIQNTTPVAVNQSENHLSNPSGNTTPG